ncbi:MAG: hypothetical protein IGS03_15535 [Candidatus Sericytochromatia bacterium]|nr:hypothetical protein [Candidatus Sericytochromatia bacterium]
MRAPFSLLLIFSLNTWPVSVFAQSAPSPQAEDNSPQTIEASPTHEPQADAESTQRFYPSPWPEGFISAPRRPQRHDPPIQHQFPLHHRAPDEDDLQIELIFS